MLTFILPEPGALLAPRELSPARLPAPEVPPGREEIRHLLVGSPQGVRATIHQLHVLNYAEQSQWSQLIAVPASGILITPRQGEVLSFLLRYRTLTEDPLRER